MSVVAGKLAEKFDKKKLILVGLAIYGVAGMLPFLAQTMS